MINAVFTRFCKRVSVVPVGTSGDTSPVINQNKVVVLTVAGLRGGIVGIGGSRAGVCCALCRTGAGLTTRRTGITGPQSIIREESLWAGGNAVAEEEVLED